ncbi:MAG: hypothetical protein PHG02_06490, partial [Oscillospiraceae bacterium]|nr:hypothetical protein [Oscillospiraceae bacterium]
TGNAEDLYAILTRLMSAEVIEDAANASDIVVPDELQTSAQEDESSSQQTQQDVVAEENTQQSDGTNASPQSQPSA